MVIALPIGVLERANPVFHAMYVRSFFPATIDEGSSQSNPLMLKHPVSKATLRRLHVDSFGGLTYLL
jgi:hypothetical protein